MIYEIKKYGEDVLKQIAKEVEINEINDEFRKFLDTSKSLSSSSELKPIFKIFEKGG